MTLTRRKRLDIWWRYSATRIVLSNLRDLLVGRPR